MDFNKFTKMMMCKVQLFMGAEYEIIEQEVTKNNSVKYTGIMAKSKDTNAFPTIYIDEMYDSSMNEDDVDYLAMKVANNLKNAKIDDTSYVYNYFNFEESKDSIYIKVINAEKNKDLLQDVPYRRWHNLAIVYFYLVDGKEDDKRATVLVRNSHLKSFEIDEKKLYETAVNNMKRDIEPKIFSMNELVHDLCGRNIIEECPMYVLCNSIKLFGASLILDKELMKEVSGKLNGNFYILPSSIHELIVLPEHLASDVKDMASIVSSINKTEVLKEEVLADSVYYYDRELDEVMWMA